MIYWRRIINKLYRKYSFNLWGEIILKGKNSKLFRSILYNFYKEYKKIYKKWFLFKYKNLNINKKIKFYNNIIYNYVKIYKKKDSSEIILNKYNLNNLNLIKIYKLFWYNLKFHNINWKKEISWNKLYIRNEYKYKKKFFINKKMFKINKILINLFIFNIIKYFIVKNNKNFKICNFIKLRNKLKSCNLYFNIFKKLIIISRLEKKRILNKKFYRKDNIRKFISKKKINVKSYYINNNKKNILNYLTKFLIKKKLLNTAFNKWRFILSIKQIELVKKFFFNILKKRNLFFKNFKLSRNIFLFYNKYISIQKKSNYFKKQKKLDMKISNIFHHLIYFCKNFAYKKKKPKYVRRFIGKDFFDDKRMYKLAKRREALLKKNPYMNYSSWITLEWNKNQARKSIWWKNRILTRKLSLYFGFINKKKFRFVQSLNFKAMQHNVWVSSRINLMISVLLLKLNIFNNFYFIKNFIKIGGCAVNNNIVTYPYRILKKGDIISINKIYFRVIFNKIIKKYITLKKKNYIIKNNSTIFNYPPDYIEINYKILTATIWRNISTKDTYNNIIYFDPFITNISDWILSSKLSY